VIPLYPKLGSTVAKMRKMPASYEFVIHLISALRLRVCECQFFCGGNRLPLEKRERMRERERERERERGRRNEHLAAVDHPIPIGILLSSRFEREGVAPAGGLREAKTSQLLHQKTRGWIQGAYRKRGGKKGGDGPCSRLGGGGSAA
jgi:hypothetical protein